MPRIAWNKGLTKETDQRMARLASKMVGGKRNAPKDRGQVSYLLKAGYKVFRFWEHEIKKDLNQCIALVLGDIQRG
jgi:very-short-patch-repair endonuclease